MDRPASSGAGSGFSDEGGGGGGMGHIVALLGATLLLCSSVAWGGPIGAVGGAGGVGGVSPSDVAAVTLDDVAQGVSTYRLPILIGISALVLVMLWAGDVIKPGSLGRSGLRDVKGLPSAVWAFCALLVMLSMPLATGAVQGQEAGGWIDSGWLGSGSSAVRRLAIPMLIGGFAGVVVALGMVYITATSALNAGLRPKAADFPIGLGLFVLALPIVLLVGELSVAIHEALSGAGLAANEIAHPTLSTIVENQSDPWTWAIIAVVVLAVPVVEEIAYRAFLQSAIFKATGQVWTGIVLTSLIFAGMHMLGGEEGGGVPWYAAMGILALGLSCGLAYERTRRIGVPIAMHASFNALNVIFAMSVTGGS